MAPPRLRGRRGLFRRRRRPRDPVLRVSDLEVPLRRRTGAATLGIESILGAPSGAFFKSFPAAFCKARGSLRVATRLVLFVNRASCRPG